MISIKILTIHETLTFTCFICCGVRLLKGHPSEGGGVGGGSIVNTGKEVSSSPWFPSAPCSFAGGEGLVGGDTLAEKSSACWRPSKAFRRTVALSLPNFLVSDFKHFRASSRLQIIHPIIIAFKTGLAFSTIMRP